MYATPSLPSESGTYKTFKARFWLYISGQTPPKFKLFPLAQKGKVWRCDTHDTFFASEGRAPATDSCVHVQVQVWAHIRQSWPDSGTYKTVKAIFWP